MEVTVWTVLFKKDGKIKQRVFDIPVNAEERAREFVAKCKKMGHPYELRKHIQVMAPQTRWERLVVFLKHGEIRWLKWRVRMHDAQIAVGVGMVLMLAYYLYMES